MSDQEAQVSWLALEEGIPVYAEGGEEIGKVAEIVADAQKDIFSGIAFKTGLLSHRRYAPAAVIGSLTAKGVHLNVAESEAHELEPYEG